MALLFSLLSFTLDVVTACPAHKVASSCELPTGPWLLQQDCLLGSQGPVSIRSPSITVPVGKRLIIDLQSEIHIETQLLRVDGELWVGCSEEPFRGDFQLHLFQNAMEDEVLETFHFGQAGLPDLPALQLSRVLLVSNTGRLELHGAPKTSWTYLAADAAAGQRQLRLESHGWRPGDEIFLAPTPPGESNFEVHRIAEVQGQQVVLQHPLSSQHLGSYRGSLRRLNAPVALLSRNLRISGAPPGSAAATWERCRQAMAAAAARPEGRPPEACHGGHVMFLQNSTVNIEHAEFLNLGQAMRMARYALHWHLAGHVAPGHGTLRNASLHRNFQRCVTLHGTAQLQLQGNVCYETFGHAFYLEDGIETGNVLEQNLVASIHPGGAVCSDWANGKGPRSNVQLGPSGFWITNPNNSFVGNHVVGANTGYWFTFLGSNNGLSGRYFQDVRSGQGSGSWWLKQHQARTPVTAFRGNAVTSCHRGVHIDGYVAGPADVEGGQPSSCRADACATCSGPLEGSFAWVPMTFDVQLPRKQRKYSFRSNIFEDFLAAHLDGPLHSEARGIWVSGGYIHFPGAIFYNVRVAAVGMPELGSACFRVLEDSAPGFIMAFTDSLFISGPWSDTFFQLYDGGIQVINSRWILADGTPKKFAVAKPKCAFGGNGNPLYLLGTRPWTPADRWDWRFPGAGFMLPGTRGWRQPLADFTCLAWDSPYINGSYLYSADGFGDGIPTIIAPERGRGTAATIKGEAPCRNYLQRTLPRFFCGSAFGRYGRWCGSGVALQRCPGAALAPQNWLRQLEPWSGEAQPSIEPVYATEELQHLGRCAFSAEPPRSTPYVWDEGCSFNGGLGCFADGSHLECRWCGFDPYPPCPEAKTSANVAAAIVAFLVGLLLLLLILCVCWYCTVKGFALHSATVRPAGIRQTPAAPAPELGWRPAGGPPHLLGRVAPQPACKKGEMPSG